MPPVLVLVISVPVAWAVSAGVRWLFARTSGERPPGWSDAGALGLMGGGVAGFAVGNVSNVTWPFALWIGLFAGAFWGLLPSLTSRYVRGIAWFSFALGAVTGLFLGALVGGF